MFPVRHCTGLPSSEQPIATPLGPALAVAVTYCVPAVLEAVVGPDRLSSTGSLSTFSVSDVALTTPAALLPASVNDSCPLVGTYSRVSTVALGPDHVQSGHCCHSAVSGV